MATDEIIQLIPTVLAVGALSKVSDKFSDFKKLPKGDKTNLKLNLKVEVGNK